MKTIMIVDDAAFLRRQLRQILESCNYKVVVEAVNGEEAIKYHELYKPELIIMDITMPVMDGIEASEEILKLDPNAKIIMCSALGHRELIIKLYRIGVLDFIVKPFHQERVKQAVDKVFFEQLKTM